MRRVHVLLCPGPLSPGVPATLAAEAMSEAWRSRSPRDRLTALPLSDGGEGLVEAVRSTLGGELVAATVPGPLGGLVPATVLVLPPSPAAVVGAPGTPSALPPGGTAVLELGQVVGAHLVASEERELAVSRGTSEGVGALLQAALQTRASRIVVGAGPAAVHDGGLGMLAALGLPSARLREGAAAMSAVRGEDLDGLASLRSALRGVDVVVACATAEPFVGLHGAGAALVTRAGLGPAHAQEIERHAGAFARVLGAAARADPLLPLAGTGAAERTLPRPPTFGSRPYGGAGGGVALALAALGARLLDGAQVVAGLVGLDSRADEASLLVTAVRDLDAAALHSGVVPAVAGAGRSRGVPTVVLAGRIEASRRELAGSGIAGAYALRERAGPFGTRVSATADELDQVRTMSARMASTWSR